MLVAHSGGKVRHTFHQAGPAHNAVYFALSRKLTAVESVNWDLNLKSLQDTQIFSTYYYVIWERG
jgi:hypothetical protein